MSKRTRAVRQRTARSSQGWIQTFGGGQFWPLAPRARAIDIRDIAHSLSLLCRFNGHCRGFYSVAEHSLHVAALLEPAFAPWGLLHDAAEAYLSDLPRPLKSLLPDYGRAENKVLRAVARRFHLDWPMPPCVKAVDGTLLATEKLALMGPEPASWGPLPAAVDPAIIRCYPPPVAEALFLQEFQRIFPHNGLQ